MDSLKYSIIDTSIGPIGIAASTEGIVHIELRCPPEEKFAKELGAGYDAEASPDPYDLLIMQTIREIQEYLDGMRVEFMVPVDMRGADFCKRVWKALMKIPFGRTCSYGDIAREVGKPRAARAVGQAVGSNPLPLVAPCHRVVGADGKLTGFGSGLDLKAYLLDLEQRVLKDRG